MTDPFSALAEPQRRRILDDLRTGRRSVSELAQRLGIPQPSVSKHLKVLRENGLVTVTQDAQRRLHQVDPRGFADFDAWLAPYRALWDGSFDALARHLDSASPREEP
ncbi:ArsR/SmtB family transcription factor [Kineococcus sp. SYSU DK003]|uniref:ArsR/SmtB family transcription factor n=1 Tax=Kineococcus sp. SYSU DK003 TaxID=3383124 RepID=UPI003D7F1601